MKYKMIISDIDGTLLTRFNKLTKRNIFAISKYVRGGGEFVLATGRSIVSTKKYIDKIDQITQRKMKYVICFNGAYVENLLTGEIKATTIPHEIVKELYQYVRKNRLNSWMYTIKATEKNSVCAKGVTTKAIAKFLKNLSILKFNNNEDMTAYKTNMFCWSKKKIARVYQELSEKYKEHINICYTNPRMIEINAVGINKGSGVQEIINNLDIKKENIIALGDSNNDYSLFQNVGASVAIKTKSKKLLEISTHSVDKKRNGVAIAIEKYVLKNDSKIKLIAADLDGTLLDDDSKLTNISVKETIRKAVSDLKIPFALATGRSIDDCLIVLKDLKLNTNDRQFIIASNGALVYDVNEQKYLFTKSIKQDSAKIIFSKIKNANGSKEYGVTGAIIYNRSSDNMKVGNVTGQNDKTLYPFYGTNHEFVIDCLTKNCPNFTRNSWAPKENIEVENLDDVQHIVKFVLYFEDRAKRDMFTKELSEMKLDAEIVATSSRNIEVTAMGVNKGVGLKVLASRLDIELDDILAIGDEGNDIEMLKLSKNSVTLASSREEVRKAASIIYDEKSSFIVSRAINELILKK